MRISDWSSDVCSSDLAPTVPEIEGAIALGGLQPSVRDRLHDIGAVGIIGRSEERRVGKSVSVRVDLGGRRIIKKKKTNLQYDTSNFPSKLTQQRLYVSILLIVL